MLKSTVFFAALWILLTIVPRFGVAQEEEWLEPSELKARVIKSLGDPPHAKQLHPDGRVWINRDEQAVIVDGYVCQRNVPLEMFACPTGTKEHESIVALYSRSQFVHAALLAVGAVPGKPVAFEPKFVPATGSTVRIYALWRDKEGKTQGTLAQNWIRQVGTQKPMEWDWVFAGSKFYKDPDNPKKEIYMGDSGELICVANFMTSTLDVAVKSDAANAGLVFDAFTDHIPKRNTPVRLVLILSDEEPFGKSAGDDEKHEPKHLKAPVPKEVLQFLPSDESQKEAPPKEAPAKEPQTKKNSKTSS